MFNASIFGKYFWKWKAYLSDPFLVILMNFDSTNDYKILFAVYAKAIFWEICKIELTNIEFIL